MSRRKGPNLQNIPIRTPEGRRVSDAFRMPKHGSAFENVRRQVFGEPPRVPPSPVVVAALGALLPHPLCVCPFPRSLREIRQLHQYKILEIDGEPVDDVVWQTTKSPDEIRGQGRRVTMLDDVQDIHSELAKILFNTPPKDAAEAKARRSTAQSIGFNALYGGSKDRFRELIEAGRQKAKL